MADCPECEYCCLIGLCCTPAEQQDALVAFFVKAGAGNAEEAAKYAAALVAAKRKAHRHGD